MFINLMDIACVFNLQVRFGDQLKLESVKTQGQYLHVSGRSQGKAGYNVLPDKYDTHTYTLIYKHMYSYENVYACM